MNKRQNEAERYLTQIRNMDREITDLILKIDFLRYRASGTGAIRYDKDHIQTSPEDMVCESLSEAVYLEGKLTERHRKLKEMREHAESVINTWGNNNARMIEVYYLQHGSMSDVARHCKCSCRNAYIIKDRALNEFSKYI